MRLARTAAIAVAALLCSTGTALACSCLPYETAGEHLAATDLVFKGRVTGQQSIRDGMGARTSFRVVETLKGRAGRTVRVDHSLSSASCGVLFRTGQTVWVFAHRRPNGAWSTGLCSAPRFDEAEYRRAARGRPSPARPPVY